MGDEDDDKGREQRRDARVSAGLVGLVLAALALLAFVIQNTDDQKVSWLVFDATLPLWLLLAITAVLGAVIANLGGWVLRRRDR